MVCRHGLNNLEHTNIIVSFSKLSKINAIYYKLLQFEIEMHQSIFSKLYEQDVNHVKTCSIQHVLSRKNLDLWLKM